MIIIKTPEEIKKLAEGGRILAEIMAKLTRRARPGVSLAELNELAEGLIKKRGGQPSFKNYRSRPSERPFPSALCASINQELVHAPANRAYRLQKGDIISLDLGMKYQGLFTDTAVTLAVGRTGRLAKKLIKVTRQALDLGIHEVKPGNFIHDISGAIQNYVEAQGFSVVRQLVGHGVGKFVHEEPRLPNFVSLEHPQIELKEGLVLAIEPMVNVGGPEVKTLADGWTVVTSDGELSAHFEHTVAVTKGGHKVLTQA